MMDLETLLNRHIELRRSFVICDARKTAVWDYWGGGNDFSPQNTGYLSATELADLIAEWTVERQ
jgi:hypothetical protein